VLAEEGSGLEISELFGHRYSQGAIKMAKVICSLCC